MRYEYMLASKLHVAHVPSHTSATAPSTFFTPSSRLARDPTPTMLGQSRFFRWQKVPGNAVPVLASATSATLQSSFV